MKINSLKIWKISLFVLLPVFIISFFNLWSSYRYGTKFINLERTLLLIFSGVIPAASFLLRKKLEILKKEAGAAVILFLLIAAAGIFAPILTPYEAGDIINAGECRLLPPFSKKILVAGIGNEGEIKIAGDSLKLETDEAVIYKKVGKVVLAGKDIEGGTGNLHKRDYNFYLGTDEFGRDLLARLLYGARESLFIGITASVISLLIALFMAYIASMREKFINGSINRLSEIFLALPSLFMVIFAISMFGNNLFSFIIVLAVTSWMSLFKILNGEIKRIRGKNFIAVSIMLKIRWNKIFFKEIIPLILPSIMVNLVFQVINFIIVEASLSFLGLGPGVYIPSWGAIIESGISYRADAWWMILFPGVLLFVTIVSLNRIAKNMENYITRI